MNNLTTFDRIVQYMKNAYPRVTLQDGTCVVNGQEVQAILTPSRKHKDFIMEFCDEYTTPRDKVQTLEKRQCLSLISNDYHSVNRAIGGWFGLG